MTEVTATTAARSSPSARGVDYRLPLIAVTSWAVILVMFWLQPPVWVQVASWLAVVLAAVLVSRRFVHQVLLALILAGLAAGSVGVHDRARNPDVLHAAAGQPVEATLEISQALTPGSTHITGVIRHVNGVAVSRVPAMVFIPKASERLALGTRIEARLILTPTRGWDSRGWIGNAQHYEVSRPSPPLFAQADSLRERFLERSLARGGDAGALLPGLSLGDTTGVPDDLERDMRRSALAHLVAVSGANCAIVVGIAVWLTALAGGSVRARLITGSVALVGFVILVTPEPSVIRASVMAVIVLFAMAIGRPFQGLPVLGITVWLLLLLNPWRAIELAFVLSVVATAGILLGYAWLAGILERVMPKPLAWFVALPLSAQLAVQPIIILLRPAIPLWGIPANVLAAPAAPLVTFFGVMGAVTEPIPGPLADLFTWLGWFPAAWIAGIARAVALSPVNEIPWIQGVPGLLALAVVTALVVAGLRAASPTLWFAGGAALFGLVIMGHTLPGVILKTRVPSDWSVAQCDVGQGDSVVYKTDDTTVVIDTGDNGDLMAQCLSLLSIQRVDYLLLTHFDRDHVGATEVFHGITDRVLAGSPENDDDRARLAALAQSGATIIDVVEGDRIDLGGVWLEVMWPAAQPLAAPGNDSSVVALFTPDESCLGCVSMVALGDIGANPQRMLTGRISGVSIDVVKVSHHGSADQYPPLYDQLNSRIALIGVGATNRYGHPASSVLDFLDIQGQHIVRSDRDGTSTISRSGPGGFQIWTSQKR